MLPALTARAPRLRRRAALFAIGSIALGPALALGASEARMPASAPERTLAERLPVATWGFVVPTAWLATSLPGVRAGDRLDVLALRPGSSAASAIAFDLEVVAIDERAITLSVTAEDATALAVARASGQLIVPLLRSTR